MVDTLHSGTMMQKECTGDLTQSPTGYVALILKVLFSNVVQWLLHIPSAISFRWLVKDPN